jgi:hypothetical protein
MDKIDLVVIKECDIVYMVKNGYFNIWIFFSDNRNENDGVFI